DVVDRRVVVALDHHQRNGRQLRWMGGGGAVVHRGKGRDRVVAAAVGKAGVHTDGGVEVGIGRGHHRGHGSAGGEAGDVDAYRVDGVVAGDLTGDAGEEGRLPPVPALVGRPEPVPEPHVVRRGGLFGVGDEKGVSVSVCVHVGDGGEVGAVLGSAGQHNPQRPGLARV